MFITPLACLRWSSRADSTLVAPVPFAGLESMAGAFGYHSKGLQMRDCGLFGRPRSHDPLLAIWLDGFNPIGAAEWNDPVGLHEVDIATIPSGAQRPPKVRPRGIRGCRLNKALPVNDAGSVAKNSCPPTTDHPTPSDRSETSRQADSRGNRPAAVGGRRIWQVLSDCWDADPVRSRGYIVDRMPDIRMTVHTRPHRVG